MRTDGTNNIFKTVVTVAVLVLFCIGAKYCAFTDSFIVRSAGQAAVFAVYPFQFALVKTIDGTRSIITSFVTLRSAQKDNYELRRKLGVERSISNAFESLAGDNKNLRQLLDFKRTNPFKMNLVPAEIITRSPSLWFQTIMVDKGSNDGVAVGKAAVAPGGLVGRVVEVFNSKSKILLITDADSAVSSKINRTSDIGAIKGTGSYVLACLYMRSDSEISAGDAVFTSGLSDFFPKGIPIGTVASISKRTGDLFLQVTVKSAVDLSKIESVFIAR